jgi:hypothetical protein
MSTTHDDNPTVRAIRILLLALFGFGVVGSSVELLLLGHTEDVWQLSPLILMGLSLAAMVWLAIDERPVSVRVFKIMMLLSVVSGLIGVYLHYRGNVEFELEMYPGLSGMELFWEALKGATPSLAPGTMLVLGLLGLLYTFRHPTLRRP